MKTGKPLPILALQPILLQEIFLTAKLPNFP